MLLFQEQDHNTEIDRETEKDRKTALKNIKTRKYKVIQCNMQIKNKTTCTRRYTINSK